MSMTGTSPSVVKTRLNALGFEPIVLPGQKIRVQQKNEYAYWELPRYATPDLIPPVDINLAVAFTTPLAVLADTGQQTGRTSRVEDWNTEGGVLAQYRFIVRDPGILVTMSQPAGAGKFANANGVTRFHYGNTMAFFKQQLWSMIPEFWVWQDETPPTLTAINADPNRTKHYARVSAFGFAYPLQFIPTVEEKGVVMRKLPDGRMEPITAATTVSVGSSR